MSKLLELKTLYQISIFENVLKKMFGEKSLASNEKEVKELLESGCRVIVSSNDKNDLKFKGYYHGTYKMVHTIVKTNSGRTIGFVKTDKGYKAIVEDYYLHDAEWQQLGEEYTDAIINKACVIHQLRKKKTKKGKKILYNLAR